MNSPIGIFDSGLGGLTVVKEALKYLPQESIVYFGDTARVPYGTKSQETITRFSFENVRFLQVHDIKMVIVACHTASSLALEEMKSAFELPILGVVDPGAQKAVSQTENERIGVIGTKSTIQSKSYEKAIKRISPNAQVFSAACPLFVSLIEEGWTKGKVVDQIVEHYLEPLKQHRIDTLILGCTHYPILKDRIQSFLPDCTLVNPAEETIKQAKDSLEQLEIKASRIHQNQVQYFVSDEPSQFQTLGEQFLGQRIQSVQRVSENYFKVTSS